MVNKTGELFDQILAGTQKAKNLINEISEASHEQSQGLDQVNQAIVQIEGVTQKNAEGAEEMATDMAFFQLEPGNPKLLPAPEESTDSRNRNPESRACRSEAIGLILPARRPHAAEEGR